MFFRATLIAAAIATAAIGSALPASAGPECPSGACVLTPSHSPSYQDGYDSEHDYYSIQQNHDFLKDQMQQQGYDTRLICRADMAVGPNPADEDDWMRGCIDALHDLGFKP